jgi:hypothetical protein
MIAKLRPQLYHPPKEFAFIYEDPAAKNNERGQNNPDTSSSSSSSSSSVFSGVVVQTNRIGAPDKKQRRFSSGSAL